MNESSQSSGTPMGDTIDIPVENMGVGVFNALGDMVGGLVELNRFACAKAHEGIALLKEKFAKSEEATEELDTTLPIDPVLRHSARPVAEESINHGPTEPVRVVRPIGDETQAG
ncbi:MAG: hypothetical protein HQL79_08380 [Magnetococcales bacterium]|nr:hypothetical protein [Magnetococcales bacterium]